MSTDRWPRPIAADPMTNSLRDRHHAKHASARMTLRPTRRAPSLARRMLGVVAIVLIAVAILGFLLGWSHLWAACAVAGVLMLIDARLLAISRRSDRRQAAEGIRRRTLLPILVGMAFIATAIAASLFEGWGWRIVGVAALAAFGLMTLIAMPMLAATAHDRGVRAESEEDASAEALVR